MTTACLRESLSPELMETKSDEEIKKGFSVLSAFISTFHFSSCCSSTLYRVNEYEQAHKLEANPIIHRHLVSDTPFASLSGRGKGEGGGAGRGLGDGGRGEGEREEGGRGERGSVMPK